MEELIRSFIAIELSWETRDELSRLQAALKKLNADIKWVEPDSIHLTLKFLGEVDSCKIKEAEEILNEAASALPGPFNLRLSGIGVFPRSNYPKVIWAGLAEGTTETTQLAQTLDKKLRDLGFSLETREFLPHITLGRVRSLRNKDDLIKMIDSTKFEPASITKVDRLTLFKSRLTAQGAVHAPIFTAKIKTS
ncbi:MAG: RNA 2',3'-cyclic phosphodiesterase [Candidatus Omnitrophota bacterium]